MLEDDADGSLRRIVTAAQGGDLDAWERLYRRGYPRLYAYARRRVSDDASADDAVSETMTRAVLKIDGFAWRGGGFDAWMYGILRNVLLEQGRRDRRDLPVAELDLGTGSDELEPHTVHARAEEGDQVRAAYAKLSDDDREILDLRVIAELSADEVAEMLGKKAGTVRMAQSRALDRLRSHLHTVGGGQR